MADTSKLYPCEKGNNLLFLKEFMSFWNHVRKMFSIADRISYQGQSLLPLIVSPALVKDTGG